MVGVFMGRLGYNCVRSVSLLWEPATLEFDFASGSTGFMDGIDFVAVRTCQSHEEATIIQNALQQEGIPCQLDNDHQGGLTGVLAIRILVPSEKKEEADQFLIEHHAD